MALFMVVALGQSAPLIDVAILQKFPTSFYKLEAGKWFISSTFQTSKELSDALGITSDPPMLPALGVATGVVVAIKGYYGRGPSDMWEWVAAKFA